jgi:WhiB family transcriptional regulator, redox-sensing transcriptional regulator
LVTKTRTNIQANKDGEMTKSWKTRAACTDKFELFFSDDRPSIVRQARKICQTCPVISECLEYSLEYGEFGVWAGLTGNQRAKLRRARKKNASNELIILDLPDTVSTHGSEEVATGGAGGPR